MRADGKDIQLPNYGKMARGATCLGSLRKHINMSPKQIDLWIEYAGEHGYHSTFTRGIQADREGG